MEIRSRRVMVGRSWWGRPVYDVRRYALLGRMTNYKALFVLLHGAGGNYVTFPDHVTFDGEFFGAPDAADCKILSIQGSRCSVIDGDGWAASPELAQALGTTARDGVVIRDIVRHEHDNADAPVILLGHSAGGAMAATMDAEYMSGAAAVVSIAMIPAVYARAFRAPWFHAHGTADQVAPMGGGKAGIINYVHPNLAAYYRERWGRYPTLSERAICVDEKGNDTLYIVERAGHIDILARHTLVTGYRWAQETAGFK